MPPENPPTPLTQSRDSPNAEAVSASPAPPDPDGTERLVVAHLADPHLDLGAPRLREALSKRALSWLNWRLKRRAIQRTDLFEAILADVASMQPDLVAMTGDLVNFALPGEFERARPWLERLGPPERVACIPGNHEALVPGQVRALHAAWGAYLRGDGAEAGFPWLRRRGCVSVIGLSTAAASLPFLATGLVGTAQLDRFDAMLGAEVAEGRLPVVLIHHPPTEITVRRKALIDRKAVRGIIARHGAGLVLHGHTHKPELSWIDGPHGRIPVIGAPSASWEPGPDRAGACWRRLEIALAPEGWSLRLEERAAVRTPSGIMIEPRTALRFVLPAAASAALVAEG